jgi:hypothetical protein
MTKPRKRPRDSCCFRKLSPLEMPVRLRQEVQALPWRAGNVALNRAPDLATAPSFTSFSRMG